MMFRRTHQYGEDIDPVTRAIKAGMELSDDLMDTYLHTGNDPRAAIAWVAARMAPGYDRGQAETAVRLAERCPGFRVAFDSRAHGDSAVLRPARQE